MIVKRVYKKLTHIGVDVSLWVSIHVCVCVSVYVVVHIRELGCFDANGLVSTPQGDPKSITNLHRKFRLNGTGGTAWQGKVEVVVKIVVLVAVVVDSNNRGSSNRRRG